jgi:hypothetical protein
MPDATTIRAPWTPEQVDALNRFQSRGGMHPFTCGNNDHDVSIVLLAHPDGWHCSAPPCDYRQDWAHAFMAQPAAWPETFPRGPLQTTAPDDYAQATGHEATCTAGFNDHCNCGHDWWASGEAVHTPGCASTPADRRETPLSGWDDTAAIRTGNPAYDAVYAYIRALGDYLPPDPVHRNATIWRAVNGALAAEEERQERYEEETVGRFNEQAIQLSRRAAVAEATVADYENRIAWETTCGEHARLLDTSYAETVRAERAETQRDQTATALREVLATFTPLTYPDAPTPQGHIAQHAVTPADYARWTAALGGAGEEAADEPQAACRRMETRTCPESYNGPCGDRPCARFESHSWKDHQ